MKPQNSFELTVAFHQGKTIIETARTYPSLPRVLMEVIQNSIDGGATRIDVTVNIPGRTFLIYDNGSGCGKEKFQSALHSLNSTLKGRDKYGQFGRGLVAPLAVAKHFDFTSCAEPQKQSYFRYRFDADAIEKQKDVRIPGFEVKDLIFDPATGKGSNVWWRTSVEAEKLTQDMRLTNLTLEALIADIALKFGEAIRSRSIQIAVTLTDKDKDKRSMNVVASEFTGEKLNVVNVKGDTVGKVIFEIYLAKLSRTGRKGSIILGTADNPSRITAHQFVASTRGILKAEVGNALTSGVFEGKILAEKIELDPDRTRFRENDALVELCVLIETWYDISGKQNMTEAREKDGDNRFQRLGKSVMPFAELILKQSRFQPVAAGIKIGTIGNGHVDVPRRDIVGPDDGTAVALVASTYEQVPRRTNGGKESDKKVPPTKEHKDHHPATIYGKGGRKRTEVRGSTGLRFEYVEMQNTTIPFEFDAERGTITFNLDHPNWSRCEESDKALLRYQMEVVSAALTLRCFSSESQEPHPEIRDYAFLALEQSVFIIVNGEAMLSPS